MLENFDEGGAGLDDPRRQAVHLDIAVVAHHQPLAGIEQQQALGHVVDRLVEALLFQGQAALRGRVIARQPAHDQEQQDGDQSHGNAADADQEVHLLLPVGERRRHGRGGDDHDRKFVERARGDQPVFAVDRADETRGIVVQLENLLLFVRTRS